MNKTTLRIVSKVGLILSFIGFCMPIIANSYISVAYDGFKLAAYLIEEYDGMNVYSFCLYALFAFACLGGILLVVQLMKKPFSILWDWVPVIGGGISFIVFYAVFYAKLDKYLRKALQFGVNFIIIGLIIALIALIIAMVVQDERSGYTSGNVKPGPDIGPAGGIVFYDKGNKDGGWQYLECAPASAEFSANWDDAIPQAQALNINGYTDWRVPTKDELNMLYQNLKRRKLGDFKDERYWSSSLKNNRLGWGQYFGHGDRYGTYREVDGTVRPVRAF